MAHLPYSQHVATNPRGVGDLTLIVADEIRAQREERELKQDELSVRAKIPRPTLSRMERGLVAIDLEQIERIAHAFDMLPEEFMASARRNAATRHADDAIFLPDGSLNPEQTRLFRTSDERAAMLAELPEVTDSPGTRPTFRRPPTGRPR